ncbi:Tubulin-folding cofactor E [Glycine soja]|nr:Tubulin-folding cofactor E [Glycine soja]
MGEKPSLTKKLPATTTVGKLKFLCESFFKLTSMKLKLYLPEEGSPFPMLLDNDTSSLMDLGIGNDSIILVDEESS